VTRPGAAGPLGVLSRIRRDRALPAAERCEMCGEAIGEQHSHVVNVGSRALLCTCRACYLLFTQPDAVLQYRAVPERYLSFPGFALHPGQWDDLQIPVGVAFFFTNSQLGRAVALYPSPAGATESELSLDAWATVTAANPELATAQPDVEAILLRVQDGHSDCYLVPIDACYQLVGQLRRLWRGFDGGQEARAELAAFFDQVKARSRPTGTARS
jgi:hypothetical protein